MAFKISKLKRTILGISIAIILALFSYFEFQGYLRKKDFKERTFKIFFLLGITLIIIGICFSIQLTILTIFLSIIAIFLAMKIFKLTRNPEKN